MLCYVFFTLVQPVYFVLRVSPSCYVCDGNCPSSATNFRCAFSHTLLTCWFTFSRIAKALTLLIIEKGHTREEVRRLIQISGQLLAKQSTEILSENKFTIGSNHEAFEFDVITGGQKTWTCAILDHGRTLLFNFDLANSVKSGLATVKKIAATIALSEPKVVGSLKVRAKKQPLEMPLPSVHYMLQVNDDESDESTILHAKDVRKRHAVTTGIRIKRRLPKKDKTMTLEELVQKRLEDLAEYTPKQTAFPTDIDGLDAIVLAYQKAIKQQHYEMVEVLFVKDQIGYICQVYELQEMAGVFTRIALQCITQLRFLNSTTVTQDTFLYEQNEGKLRVEIPARLQHIKEYPLSDEMLVDFMHDTGDAPDVEYMTLILKKKMSRKLIGDLETLKEHIRTDIDQQNKVFKEYLGNPQIASQFGDLITLQTCEVDNSPSRPAVKIVARSYNPANMDQQKTYSTYVLDNEDMYTLQTTISERFDTEATRKEIEQMHSTFYVQE